jgi:hypothetical protein
MQSHGISFKSITIGDIKDIVKSQGDLYSVIQEVIQVSMSGSIVTSSSYLLAYSHNSGLRWYFTETKPLNNNKLKQLFPTYPADLVIPQTHSPLDGD